MEVVETAYVNVSKMTLNDGFLSLQNAMARTMPDKGVNTYKLCHMSMDKLQGQGKLLSIV